MEELRKRQTTADRNRINAEMASIPGIPADRRQAAADRNTPLAISE
jgi:hypothetical protein